jgi:hypothetical protein
VSNFGLSALLAIRTGFSPWLGGRKVLIDLEKITQVEWKHAVLKFIRAKTIKKSHVNYSLRFG